MKFTGQFFLFCLLALGASLPLAAQTPAPDDLQGLSDEFTDEKSLADWKQFHEAEGWMTMTRTLDVNKTSAGQLYFEPATSGWYGDFHGAFLFKEVTGDFLATARLKVGGKTGELPTALWSLAGLMIREPRPGTNKDKWQAAGENWLFFTTGIAEPAGQMVFETKSTVNSRSNLKLRPAKTGWVELAVARVRAAFILLYRFDGESKWTVQERFHRRDLPRTVQVGINAYSDWYGAQEFHNDPLKFNTVPAKNSKADLVVTVDYVRFRRLQSPSGPRSDAGELTDYGLSNEELIKKLGL